jgi:hypothetical protein
MDRLRHSRNPNLLRISLNAEPAFREGHDRRMHSSWAAFAPAGCGLPPHAATRAAARERLVATG